MKKGIVIGAVLLTLLANLICLSFWTKYDWKSLIDTYRNREARFDITYTGRITAADPIKISGDINSLLPRKHWTGGEKWSLTITLPIRKKWQHVSFIITPIRDGKIELKFMGPFKRLRDDKNKAYPIFVDFRNLAVAGQVISPDTRVLWYDKSFKTSRPIKTNKPLTVSFEVRQHRFNGDDLDMSGKIWFAITGNILSFLFFYGCLSWFSRQKIIQGGGIDKIFLVIFFVFLFLPMSSISEGDKNFREKRVLAVKPELSEVLRKRVNYGKCFEDWYNDHFGGRDQLVKMWSIIQFYGNRVVRSKRAIYFKEDGWLFVWPPILDHFPEIVNPVCQSIAKFNEFCQRQNIKFYILEVPAKEVVYQNYLYKFGFDKKCCYEVEQILREVRDRVRKFGVPYIYPFHELRDASVNDYTFFKWSVHWSDWGAYIGYLELMQKVKKDFPDIPIVTLEDYHKSTNVGIREGFHRGYGNSGLPRFFNVEWDDTRAVSYTYYDHKRANQQSLKVGKFTKETTYVNGRYKIMLIGTSQSDNFFPFLSYSGAQTKYIRLNMAQAKSMDVFKVMKLYKKDILSFKPKILVFCITSGNLPFMQDLFKN